mgnify:CR=1 FL=1
MKLDKEIYDELNKQDWELIIKNLTVYAIYQFKFWGLVTEKGIKGYSPEEIVYEAIEKVYLGEWNWDPNKADVLTYLKYHVVRGLIANLANSEEVKRSDLTDLNNHTIESSFFSNQSEASEYNAQIIIDFLKKKIGSDEDVQIIFRGYCDGLKRRDICEVYGMTHGDFNNAYRRFQRIIKELNKENVLNSMT